MHYFLLIGAFLWFAFMAPPMVTLATMVSFGLVAMVGARTATAVTGAPASWGEVLRSMGLAFAFTCLALFGMMAVGAVNLVFLIAALLGACVMGFKIGMGVQFGAACIIALVTTVLSAALYSLIKSVL